MTLFSCPGQNMNGTNGYPKMQELTLRIQACHWPFSGIKDWHSVDFCFEHKRQTQ